MLNKIWLIYGGTKIEFMVGSQHGTTADGEERYFKVYVQFREAIVRGKVEDVFGHEEWDMAESYGHSEDFIDETRDGEFLLDVPELRFGIDAQALSWMDTEMSDPDGTFTP